jgi:putative transcriptional regulator
MVAREDAAMSFGRSTLRNFAFASVALVALAAPRPAAAPSDPAEAPGQPSLAGQFLVASSSMGDPRFAETVILMVRHDASGALGIVVNRPLRERPAGDLLEALGEPRGDAKGSVRIFFGGPVQPELGFVVHTADYRKPDSFPIGSRFAMTGSREIIRDILQGRGPKKSLIAFGYAGWAPGQLENELKLNAWHTAPADEQLIFDEDRERLWERAMERRTREL